MVTKELIGFINSQRLLGKDDQTIRSELLTNRWPEEDINLALLKTIEPIEPIKTKEDSPSLQIKVVSILLFLIGILYILSTISLLRIVMTLDSAFSSNELVAQFIKYFPTFGIIPIMFSIIVVTFFYLATKAASGSRSSFLLGIVGLLLIPIPAAIVSQLLMSPLLDLLAKSSDSGILGNYVSSTAIRIWDPIFVLSFITLILLLVSFRKFTLPPKSLSLKFKLFVLAAFILLVIPTSSVIGYGYLKSTDTDYGFTPLQSQVAFKIFKPDPSLTDLINTTKFLGDEELAGKNNAIKVAYDTLIFDQLAGIAQPKLVILNEVGVETDFNVEEFIISEVKNASTPQDITLEFAKNQKAFYMERQLGETTLRWLAYLTPDNVLIFIASPYLTKDELVNFANSLK